MHIDDDIIPSEEDVKPENEDAEIEVEVNPEGETSEDGPQHEDNSDASNDEDEGQEPEADDQPVEEQPPRKQSKTSKRFQQLANERRLAEERAERAEAALAQLTNAQDDDDYDEFDMDSVIRKSSKETARVLQEQTAAQAREEANRISQQQTMATVEAFAEAEAEFAAKVPDYLEAVKALDSLPQNRAVSELIVTSDQGPEVAYYLAKNPNEARKVVNMSPIEAAKFIGGIEARLTAPPARTTTKAPKPVPKVTGKSLVVDKTDDELSYQEYRVKHGLD